MFRVSFSTRLYMQCLLTGIFSSVLFWTDHRRKSARFGGTRYLETMFGNITEMFIKIKPIKFWLLCHTLIWLQYRSNSRGRRLLIGDSSSKDSKVKMPRPLRDFMRYSLP